MKDIAHKGRIVEITPEFTTVEIISESACSGCHAASLCGISEYKKKAVQVPTRGWDNYAVGDEVQVLLKASMGHKAVWIAYVIPLFVLLAGLLGLNACGCAELISGLGGLALVAVYYLIVWFLRDKLRKEYIFTIE
ncbi:MAG: SoxR reducing system RseC family protein [Bacteroidales bacterium]|nr:SoxR reducing system RseC family protein [Bacteroidales bacterium]